MENTSIEIEIVWRFRNTFVEWHVAIEVDEVSAVRVQPQTIIIISLLERYHFWLSAFRSHPQYMRCVTLPNISLYCWWKQQMRLPNNCLHMAINRCACPFKDKQKTASKRKITKPLLLCGCGRACVDLRRFQIHGRTAISEKSKCQRIIRALSTTWLFQFILVENVFYILCDDNERPTAN